MFNIHTPQYVKLYRYLEKCWKRKVQKKNPAKVWKKCVWTKSCETHRCAAETQVWADQVISLAQLVLDCADWRNEVIRHTNTWSCLPLLICRVKWNLCMFAILNNNKDERRESVSLQGSSCLSFLPSLQTEQTSQQDNTRMSIICRQQPSNFTQTAPGEETIDDLCARCTTRPNYGSAISKKGNSRMRECLILGFNINSGHSAARY